MKNKIPYLQEWLDLANTGKFERAQELYFEKLFEAVIAVLIVYPLILPDMNVSII